MADLQMEAFEALLRLSIDVRRHVEAVAESSGVTPPMARIVTLLEEPTRMSALAEAIGCEPSHVTGVAQDLERADLARRVVDPADRRARLLALTDEGRALRERLRPALLADAPALSLLDPSQLTQLLELIRPA